MAVNFLIVEADIAKNQLIKIAQFRFLILFGNIHSKMRNGSAGIRTENRAALGMSTQHKAGAKCRT
jgi:hypothetical protein